MDITKYKSPVPDFHKSPLGFKGGRFEVRIIDVEANSGNTLKREVVVHPGSVLILPLIDPDHLVLIRNQRFAIDQTLWELPAGTLEPGEFPLVSAGRELTEETGYTSEKITLVGTFFTTPGFCNELMHSYIAEKLTHVGQNLDENEHITVKIVPIEEAIEMIRSGTINDAKTIAAILYYKNFLWDSYATKK